MPSLTAEDERIIERGAPDTTVNSNDSALIQAKNDTILKQGRAWNDYYDMDRTIRDKIGTINSTLSKGTNQIRQAMDEKTQANINELNNQMKYAEQDYKNEARGAYNSYQKQVDPYGAEAEYLQRNGLDKSGYSETARISAYTAYQNRVATARESWNRSYDNFSNQIAQARATNNLEQAQLSYQTLQAQMSNLMTGLQWNMQNYQNLQSNLNQLESLGLQRENMVYDRLNNDLNRQWTAYNNAVNRKYDLDQYNDTMAYKRERDQVADEQQAWQRDYSERELAYQREKDEQDRQLNRDKMDISNYQWQQEFDYNKANNDRNFNYNKEKDERDYNLSKSNADRTYELNKLNSDRDYEINKAKINASTYGKQTVDRNGNTVNMAPATETIIRDLAPKVQDYTKRYGVMMNQEVFANGLKQYILNELNKYNITDAQKKTVLQTMKLM